MVAPVAVTKAPAVPLLSVLGEAATVARAVGRGDLVARLGAAVERVRDPRRRIVIAGQVGQGKSRFVNALLNVDICAVGDDATTVVPAVLAHGAEADAHLVLADPHGGGPEARVAVPVDETGAVDARTPLAEGRRVTRLEIQLPNPLLADGIVLVDTPGVGGHGNAGVSTVLGMVPAADAVLIISDASTELTEPELSFLRQVRELCPTVALVLTKIDLYPHWRRVLDADRAHLDRAGLDVPIIPVSSLLRTHAMRTQDPRLGAESGFGTLYQFLREQVVARDMAATRAAVARDIHAAAEHLALTLGSELVALRDPEQAAAAIGELTGAKAAAEDLHRRTATWQQTLADGITDLAGDVDHDLRDRLRGITRTGEEWIDGHDPGRHWDAIAEWLAETVDSALGDNLLWTHKRAVQLAERVGEHFAHVGAVDLPDVRAGLDDGDSRAGSGTLADLEPDIGFTSKVLVGLRGSYGGVLMVGLASTFAGLAMLNPISLGAGVIVGGKAFRDDKQARLARRRAEAKNAVRRFVDDVAFQAGKESKDRLHRIHRALRDHYAGVAERSLRSLEDSLRAAQEAATMETARRAERCAELERQLRVVAELRRYADAVPGAAGTVAG
ncbi:dynamin family protein [Nocardia puris]|uniref:Replication fork clamp-binding protein CrfC n=1 Tax=Nocardia puris TaxID=208602 RepID=A0A366DD05_9NOCA|nr:dynamin family protein [Nocardia puris]MBF6214948.1 dynamin family protein [Nocardia puris]MBF6364792.1 dynamin family protein [Nocardia puris]MBF6460233.1 dynamin family protein [Nocardia puris]RBO87923.1 replication fork clamp-binding protein CrfC [Nocardia puris]